VLMSSKTDEAGNPFAQGELRYIVPFRRWLCEENKDNAFMRYVHSPGQHYGSHLLP
jgi:hypothetical protein